MTQHASFIPFPTKEQSNDTCSFSPMAPSANPSRPRKKTLLPGLMLVVLCLVNLPLTQAAEVQLKGLRGADVAAPDEMPAGTFRTPVDTQPYERSYEQQPPMIPHKIDGYEITLNFNRCMDCHSPERYEEMNATKVGESHFKTREGEILDHVSPRRYFCVQCHVPQTDARPLVENTFQRPQSHR